MATESHPPSRTINFEVSVRRNGRWEVHATYSVDERSLALHDAKRLEREMGVDGTRVVKETWHADDNRAESLAIYISPALEKELAAAAARRLKNVGPAAARRPQRTPESKELAKDPARETRQARKNRSKYLSATQALLLVLMTILISCVVGGLVAVGTSVPLQHLRYLGLELSRQTNDAILAGGFLLGSGFCFLIMLRPILRRLPPTARLAAHRLQTVPGRTAATVGPALSYGRPGQATPPAKSPVQAPAGEPEPVSALPVAAAVAPSGDAVPAAEAVPAEAAIPAPTAAPPAVPEAVMDDPQGGAAAPEPPVTPQVAAADRPEAAVVTPPSPASAPVAPSTASPEPPAMPSAGAAAPAADPATAPVPIATLVRARFDAFELALAQRLRERAQELDPSHRFALSLYLAGAADRLVAAEGVEPGAAHTLLAEALARFGPSAERASEFGAALDDYLVQSRTLNIYQRGRDALVRQLAGADDAIDIEQALAEWDRPAPTAAAGPEFLTVLHSRIRRATDSSQTDGEAALQAHDKIVRNALAEHDGREVRHTGDGIVACFKVPSRAVEAAGDVLAAMKAHNRDADAIALSLGLDAGEAVRGQDDLAGDAAELPGRLCLAAEPGQALASSVVRMLCAQKSDRFEFLGETALDDEADPVTVYAIVAGDVAEPVDGADDDNPESALPASEPIITPTQADRRTGDGAPALSPRQSLIGRSRSNTG